MDTLPKHTPQSRRQPRQYGTSCTSCVRAKSRCTPFHGDETICERCQRLGKDCQPAPTTRKRRVADLSLTARTKHLEEKLDEVVSLLNPLNPQTAETRLPVRQQNCATRTTQPSPLATPAASSVNSDTPPYVLRDAFATAATQAGLAATPGEEDQLLLTFRAQLSNYLPFVLIEESMAASQLRDHWPFFWLTITTVASKSTDKQFALSRNIKEHIGHKMFVTGEKSLDLLLGLLTFITWGRFTVYPAQILTNFMQLAIALVYDLGLNKPVSQEPAHRVLWEGLPEKTHNVGVRTMQERRALLGCYVASTTIASYFQKLEPLRWTPYFNESLQVLLEHKEHPSDLLLANLVRLMLVTESSVEGARQSSSTYAIYSDGTLAEFHHKAIQARLEKFKKEVSPELQQNKTILLGLYGAEVAIHECSVSTDSNMFTGPNLQRVDSLYNYLHATKNWLDLFFSIPPAEYVAFPTSILSQLGRCLLAAFKITTFDHPDWDLALVAKSLSMPLLLEQVIQKMARVKIDAGLDSVNEETTDVFTRTARKFSAAKVYITARVEGTSVDEAGHPTHQSRAVDDAPSILFDDIWMNDILFGPCEYSFDAPIP